MQTTKNFNLLFLIRIRFYKKVNESFSSSSFLFQCGSFQVNYFKIKIIIEIKILQNGII